jgi:hypothetical protein
MRSKTCRYPSCTLAELVDVVVERVVGVVHVTVVEIRAELDVHIERACSRVREEKLNTVDSFETPSHQDRDPRRPEF